MEDSGQTTNVARRDRAIRLGLIIGCWIAIYWLGWQAAGIGSAAGWIAYWSGLFGPRRRSQ